MLRGQMLFRTEVMAPIDGEIRYVMLSGEKCYVASSSSSSKNEKKIGESQKKGGIRCGQSSKQ